MSGPGLEAARMAGQGLPDAAAPKGAFDQSRFDQLLLASAQQEDPAALDKVLTGILEAGGKRIRPRLVHWFGGLAGADPEAVMQAALAVEMLHCATLVHDDLIDQAESRRGRPALHRTHGADVALLVGDLYVSRAGVHAAATGDPRVGAELFAALDLMVRGELDQRGRRFDLSQTTNDYLQAIQRKTGVLFQAAGAAAVMIGPGDESQVHAARQYGQHLGVAFQVVDDVLDFVGDPADTGKPVGNDIREGTVTLPLILTLELSPAPVAAIVDSAREAQDFGAVIQAVRRSGALERCRELAAEHARRATDSLDGVFPDTADRQALIDLAMSLPERNL